MDHPNPRAPGRIELRLRALDQLFNSLDPSPFIERDLAREAEEFIVSWAREHPRDAALHLVLHLEQGPPDAEAAAARVAQAVHNYFAYRARLARLERRELFRRGRASLGIGLLFLTACLLTVQALDRGASGGALHGVLRESLLIGGWVAMWRPLEIYLYDWWPLSRAINIHERLATLPVELRLAGGGAKA
jgi:hypothetical protein